jgi:hypothetical protein
MKRRTLLGDLGAAGAAVSLAGCSLLGGCGPGDDEIGDLADRVRSETPTPEPDSTATEEAVRVKGSIQSVSEEAVVIDDGTGTAKLLALGGFYVRNVEEGDCARATGYPTEPEDDADVDVTILITEMGLAEDG